MRDELTSGTRISQKTSFSCAASDENRHLELGVTAPVAKLFEGREREALLLQFVQ